MFLRIAFVLALAAGLLLSACRSTGRTAEDAAGATADATADAAEATADAITDAAGAVYHVVADVFDADTDAAALVRPTTAGSAEGTVRFMGMDDGVHVAVSLRGLRPGQHGLHIHTNGACGPADTDGDGQPDPAGAAGPHWDPMGTDNHGGPDDGMDTRHLGDLGNVEVGADGTVEAEMMIDDLGISGAHGVVGHALVVHSGQDDLESEPSGNSGTPVGCGVVTAR